MRYERPTSLMQACELLASGATPLAGGTDLLPRYEQGRPLPKLLVDLKHLPELMGVREVEGGIELGALTSMNELLEHPLLVDRYHALVQSARDFAGVQIRNRATIGGNLCNASPAGDTLPPFYAYDATVVIANAGGERAVPIDEFILGPGQTLLKPDELLKAIRLPVPPPSSRFFKLGLRDAMAISVVNAAVAGELEGDGHDRRFKNLVIAVGAVAPTIVRLVKFADAALENPGDLHEKLSLIDEEISPIDDIRATASYRRKVLKNLIEQTLMEMLGGDHE